METADPRLTRSNKSGGESPLLPGEACVLGSINVASCYLPKENKIDMDKLSYLAEKATIFLNNVIDVSDYPIPSIREAVMASRKIGLGVMGWADLLALLGVPYASNTALEIADMIMGHIKKVATQTSIKIAEKDGVYPNWREGNPKTRNATLTSIAPTGTISMFARCSSGIEPFFALSYDKVVMDGTRLPEFNKIFESAVKAAHPENATEVLLSVSKTGKMPANIHPRIKEVFATSPEIATPWHMKMQAVFQKHTDLAVSKTINLPSSASQQDVKNVYTLAHSLGCKGITVYRDGSRADQVIQTPKTECTPCTQNTDSAPKIHKVGTPIVIRPRVQQTTGTTTKIPIACGSLFVTINSDDQGICEVFTNLGKGGGCESQSEATARLISIALRAGIDPKEITGQLKGIKCPATLRKGCPGVLSCPDAIGKAMDKLSQSAKTESKHQFLCPECTAPMAHMDGCRNCLNCGYSKCN